MVSIYTNARYNSLKIIFKITIIEISYTLFILVLIEIVVNNAIYNAKRTEFIFPCFE